MLTIKWRCYCGNVVREQVDDGQEGDHYATYDCELACCKTGEYSKSPYWDKSKDVAVERKQREGALLRREMQKVKPVKKDRRREKC